MVNRVLYVEFSTALNVGMKSLLAILIIGLSTSLVFATDNSGQSGRIYMVNNNRWGYNRAMGFKVDGHELKADRRKYSFIEIPVGVHYVQFGKEKANINVEPGKSYYFTLTEQAMGWGGFRLTRLSQEEAEFNIQTLRADEKQISAAK